MNSSDKNPIFPESPEAATFQTGLSGWVDRHGRFWGDDEKTARYCGSTHRKCKCGAIIYSRSFCAACARNKDIEKYQKAEKVIWDGKTPLYSQSNDLYFFDANELKDFIGDNSVTNIDELELFICEPNHLSEIQDDYWLDDLPEDGELPGNVQSALDALNKAIDEAEPASWSPGKCAAIVEI